MQINQILNHYYGYLNDITHWHQSILGKNNEKYKIKEELLM